MLLADGLLNQHDYRGTLTLSVADKTLVLRWKDQGNPPSVLPQSHHATFPSEASTVSLQKVYKKLFSVLVNLKILPMFNYFWCPFSFSRAKSRKQFQNSSVSRALQITRGRHLVFVCPDYPWSPNKREVLYWLQNFRSGNLSTCWVFWLTKSTTQRFRNVIW